jgi:signal peptidase
MEITPQDQPRTGRFARILVNLVCTVVSLLAIGFILPAAFGLERYVIAGGSMTGTISRGSVVFEEVVPVADLEVGDVITYMPPADSGIDNLVTHRIVAIKGDAYRTKGDANPQSDPWTFQLTAATQPRVVAHVPIVGYAVLALQDPDTRKLVIGGPAALVALLALKDLLLGLRRRKPEAAPDVLVDAMDPMDAEDAEELELAFSTAAAAPVVLIPAQPVAGAGRARARRSVRASQRTRSTEREEAGPR